MVTISSILQLGKTAIDLLIPPLCLSCNEPIMSYSSLCTKCWQDLVFVGNSFCKLCGTPFELDLGQDMACSRCLAHPHAFDRARTPFVYRNTAQKLILKFKHSDRQDLAPFFANWIYKTHATFFEGADCLMPVPLHWTRYLSRLYNQSALLGNELSLRSGIPLELQTLKRKRRTKSQAMLNGKDRKSNIKKAFTITKSVKDMRIILIDDVITTGSTVDECAKTLKRHGARQIDIVAIGNVSRKGILR